MKEYEGTMNIDGVDYDINTAREILETAETHTVSKIQIILPDYRERNRRKRKRQAERKAGRRRRGQ